MYIFCWLFVVCVEVLSVEEQAGMICWGILYWHLGEHDFTDTVDKMFPRVCRFFIHHSSQHLNGEVSLCGAWHKMYIQSDLESVLICVHLCLCFFTVLGGVYNSFVCMLACLCIGQVCQQWANYLPTKIHKVFQLFLRKT